MKKFWSATCSYYLPFALVITPILLHFLLIGFFAVGTPWLDDFFWYFGFLKQMQGADTFAEKLGVLFSTYNNHWHVFQRLLILLITKVTGIVPIKALMWIGNLIYLGLFGTVLFQLRRNHTGWITTPAIVMAWFFFQPVSHFNFFECAFFNLPVLLFAYLTIDSFAKGRNTHLLWGFLATFSNGNGLFVWIVVLAMSLRNRAWKKAIFSGMIFFTTISFNWWLGRELPSVGRLHIFPLDSLLLYGIQMVGTIGTIFNDNPKFWFLNTLMGLAFVGVFSWLGITLKKEEVVRWYFILFLLATVGIVSLTRRELDGFAARIVSHYLLFPQLLWGFIIAILLDRYQKASILKVLMPGIVIAVSLCNYVLNLPPISIKKAIKIADNINYKESGIMRLYPPIQGEEEYSYASRMLDYAVRKGIYRPPVFQRSLIDTACELEMLDDSSIATYSVLPWRILHRCVITELVTNQQGSLFLPTEQYDGNLLSWVYRKKGKQVSGQYFLEYLIAPVNRSGISSCRVWEISR